jgi:GntR family transcriptional regulator
MGIDFDSGQPIYLQLVRYFSIRIVCGEWTLGARVMSVRDLAIEYGVNPNTVQKALSELERQGLVYSERTSGRYITQDQEKILAIRSGLILEEIQDFIRQMDVLGCSKQEWMKLIEDNMKKEQD